MSKKGKWIVGTKFQGSVMLIDTGTSKERWTSRMNGLNSRDKQKKSTVYKRRISKIKW